MHELKFPTDVQNNADGKESARICITGDKLTFVVLADLWERPAAWGIVMADLARQVAAALQDPADRDRLLEDIRSAFDAEWSHPTE
jgi:hypothetical protein